MRERPRRIPCPNCGKLVWSTDHICMYCGAELKPWGELDLVEGSEAFGSGSRRRAKPAAQEGEIARQARSELQRRLAERLARQQQAEAPGAEGREGRAAVRRARLTSHRYEAEAAEAAAGAAGEIRQAEGAAASRRSLRDRRRPSIPRPGRKTATLASSAQWTLLFVRRTEQGDPMTYGPYDVEDILEMIGRGQLDPRKDEASPFPDRGWEPLWQVVARYRHEMGPAERPTSSATPSALAPAPTRPGEEAGAPEERRAVRWPEIESSTKFYVRMATEGAAVVTGPLDLNTILQKVADGQLSPEDQISPTRHGGWRPIRQVLLMSTSERAAGRPRARTAATKLREHMREAVSRRTQQPSEAGRRRSPYVAAFLAFFFGSLGAHKFYNGSLGWGTVYLIFCCTGFPAMMGFLEGLGYLVAPRNYDLRYNETPPDPWKW